MDDDITRIHQNPVAGWHALNLGCPETGIFQVSQQAVSHGIYMTMRPSAGDDHVVGNGRFSDDIDVVGVFRLGIIKAGKDCFQKRLGLYVGRCAGRLCLCVQFIGLSVALDPEGTTGLVLTRLTRLTLRWCR